MNKTLKELTHDLLDVHSKVSDNYGEIDEKLETELAQIQKDLATKADHYSYRMERLEHMAKFWEEKEAKAKAVKVAIKNHIKSMRDRIKDAMVQMDAKELFGQEYCIKIRPTPRPKVVVSNPQNLPVKYKIQVIETKIDSELIREDLNTGIEINGAFLENSFTLNIGPKRE